MPIIPLPEYYWRPTSSVQPFTYKDGMSYLQILERLRGYITKTLVPWLENEINNFEDSVEDNITLLTNYVNESVNKIINNSVELQDAVAASLITSESLTKDALDARYASVGRVSDIETGVEALEQLTSIGRLSDTELTAKIVGAAYSKADSDNRYPSKDSVFTKTDSDNRYPLKSDVYTKTAVDAALDLKANKTDIIVPPNSVTKPIIAAHFLRSDEAIMLAFSLDGENFEESNIRWKPINNAELGTAYARDPSIVEYGGFYYIAYTRVGSATGGAFGSTKAVGLVRVSSDFATWTPMDPIVMPGNQVNTWAPEWYVGVDGLPSIIVAYRASTNDQFEQYLITPSNPSLTAWNAPQKMVGLTGKIDCTILKIGNTFHAFVADQPEMRMMHYTASAITGPYTKLATSEINTGPFAGLEGPSIVKLNRGGWRMYLDAYGQVDSIYYTDSFDLIHWSALKPVSLPMRHIGTLQVDRMPLRKYPPIRPNIVAAELDTAPYWGAKRKPTDVDKEWVETITINTGSSWQQILPITQMGFSGVDGMFAQIMHGDNLDVCTVRIQIPADSVVAITLLDFAGNIMTNKTARVAYRIIGWGPPENR